MENCFNYAKCFKNGFKIFIHPYLGDEKSGEVSDIYQNIIESAKRSSSEFKPFSRMAGSILRFFNNNILRFLVKYRNF